MSRLVRLPFALLVAILLASSGCSEAPRDDDEGDPPWWESLLSDTGEGDTAVVADAGDTDSEQDGDDDAGAATDAGDATDAGGGGGPETGHDVSDAGDATDGDDGTLDVTDPDTAEDASGDARADGIDDTDASDTTASDAADALDVTEDPDGDTAHPDTADADASDADATSADADAADGHDTADDATDTADADDADDDTSDADDDTSDADDDASDADDDASDAGDADDDATDTAEDATEDVADASDDATDTGEDVADATGDASDDSGDSGDDADSTTDTDPWADVDPFEQSDPHRLGFDLIDMTGYSGVRGLQWVLPTSSAGTPCGEALLLTGGAAVEDFDDDGDLDLFLPRIGLPDQLWQNDGTGRFVDIAPALGLDDDGQSNGAYWLDLEPDGDFDLFVTRIRGPNRVYRNEGGAFAEVAAALGLDETEFIDVDGCNKSFGLTVADWNADGRPDLVVTRWSARSRDEATILFQQQPDGTFVAVNEALTFALGTRSFVFGVRFLDLDADGDRDLYVVADFETSRTYEWTGTGFVNRTGEWGGVTEENGMGSAMGDFDGDGDLDLFVTSISHLPDANCSLNWGCSGNRFYRNDGTGHLVDETGARGVGTGGWGWGTAMIDIENDRDLDLIMTNGYHIPWEDLGLQVFVDGALPYGSDPHHLWLNSGRAMLEDVAPTIGFDDPANGRSLIPFDVERDGDLDLVITQNGGEPQLWRNTAGAAGAGMVVRVRSPRHLYGVGARLEFHLDNGEILRRDVDPYGYYLGSGPHEAHVGLGDLDARIPRVVAIWPDGTRTVWENVTPAPYLELRVPE